MKNNLYLDAYSCFDEWKKDKEYYGMLNLFNKHKLIFKLIYTQKYYDELIKNVRVVSFCQGFIVPAIIFIFYFLLRVA